ncbi:MAG: hypothetical protein CFH22_00700 [Alphaproteobacteria bacterium MarineAlpha5_Bin12]|nr:MAG: hypothetical protein CFH22_00700 [Alphaproteobacteria bacterium MarineAlpha5_Bin12]|tara:strand:- start:9451 stop:10242 length:792 start_codon:yes stop_codon:yes gene_type:complete
MKYFFCFGFPKSGTTYLQMILNSHPDLSCPSEHQLDEVLNQLPQLITEYNKKLLSWNKSTSQQNLKLFNNHDVENLAKSFIKLALKRGGEDKKVKKYGIKDNGILRYYPLIKSIFPDEKYIMILRDPRNVAISQWYNYLKHQKSLKKNENIDEWTLNSIKIWEKRIKTFQNYLKSSPKNVLICKYEKLKKETNELKKIYKFLSVKSDPNTIKKSFKLNKLDNFKNKSFFRSGFKTDWNNELKKKTNDTILNNYGKILKEFKYI